MYSTGELVRKAQGGDQSAIAVLYQQTYNKAYYTVRSMIRDEDAVFDILQDAYIKAFTYLGGLGDGERFEAWVRQIAANTARDWLKKKRPMLFSEMEGSSRDVPPEEWFEDDNIGHLPEYVIDRNETARLVREILDELPEDQRAAIGMYYYEEMSVREIAASMNATENAVKSRLMYGRRRIEKKVRELEKRGTKLYGLAPAAFLLWLMRAQDVYAAEIPDARIQQNVLRELAPPSSSIPGKTMHTAGPGGSHAANAAGAARTAGAVNAAGAAKAASAGGAGFSAAKIALAAAAALAVIGGGAAGLTKLAGHAVRYAEFAAAAEAPEFISASDPGTLSSRAPESSPENEMFTGAAESSASVLPEEPAENDAHDADTGLEAALGQYRAVIAGADTCDFGEYAYPNGQYLYALEYMHTGDPVPTLLLCQLGDDYIDHVRIFYYDEASGTMAAPGESIAAGVAGTGGFRGGLSMMGDGNGLQVFAAGGMRGDIYISRAVRSGDQLVITQEWSGFLDDHDPYRDNAREITWYDVSDEEGLEEALRKRE